MAAQVLLIEDDESIRESLVEVVESEGYRVAAAANGSAALSWLDAAPQAPALILLDLMMPVMDGLEFLQRLRALRDDEKRSTPVIVLTASRSPAAPGIVATLSKPINLAALLAAMHGVLNPQSESRKP